MMMSSDPDFSLRLLPGASAHIRVEHDGRAYVVPAWVVAAAWMRGGECDCDSAYHCGCNILGDIERLESFVDMLAWSTLRPHAELDPDAIYYCDCCNYSLLSNEDSRCAECVAAVAEAVAEESARAEAAMIVLVQRRLAQ